MAVTPQEIHSKQFTTRSNKWFDKSEVTDFLDQIAVDYDNLLQENQALRTKLLEADSNATQVEEMKQSVNSSILIAQEAADRLKKQTEAEAEATLQQAETEAQKIVMEANAKANNLLSESQQKNADLVAHHDAMAKEMAAFKERISGLLNAQLDLMNTEGWAEFQKAVADQPNAPESQVTQVQPGMDDTSVSESESETAPKETVVVMPDLEENKDNYLNQD
ncbi:cell division initiation protein [Weissella uvarum]|uniref:DivIVA domain-containing protein n=1 Tax=Weissella uvarum TaxID=1479233 RepID=UPI0019602217|nr:DivIVA domain-containing protein [Weissella uvarum]MBM7617784.1 cell division initiation protein [Weissella uvarum]MCM0595837.1 DivIVA domain-containing protein [Weissella uvarum]